MTGQERYLPLFDETNSWISRPDLYVLVRMSVSDDQGEEVVWQAYRHITELSDGAADDLNTLDALFERKFISGHLSERRQAAMVLVEMLRLSVNKEKPTPANAIKLITRFLHAENNARTENSISDQVKRAFRKWRNTCHLEAAFRLDAQGPSTFENDPAKFGAFLARAKAFELFMDEVSAQRDLQWNPWRVPKEIAPAFSGRMEPLSVKERALIGKA